MSEHNQGMVIPFGLPSVRMRRSAAEYRRRGQVLEALSLMRRAAEQDDSTAGWLQTATELRQLCCWEAAAALLARVLSREDCPMAAWVEMARCQMALERNDLAMDCLNRPLQEAPWSPEGDEARELIFEMGFPEEKERSRRAKRMAQRGMQEWQRGDRALGNRRIRRALRIMQDPEKVLISLAMMHLLQGDHNGALRYLARALKRNGDSVSALCTLAAVLQQTGRPRAARAFLRQALLFCSTLRDDSQFLTTAWAMSAWPEMEELIDSRMRLTPHRTELMLSRAAMLFERGRTGEAQEIWRQVLSIDPDDRQAASFQAIADRGLMSVLPMMGGLPPEVRIRQRAILFRDGLTADTLLRPGTQEHRALLWMAVSADENEQQLALDVLRRCGSEAGEKRFLRELLCRPGLTMNMSRMIIMRLAEMGDESPILMLMGDGYSVVQCQQAQLDTARRTFRRFLPLLLQETRRWKDGAGIAGFAAALWEAMTMAQRRDAAGSGGYLWCCAMEIIWLRMSGMEKEAMDVVRRMPVSARRVSRILRQLGRILCEECE